MRKKVSALIATFVILASMLFPWGGLKKAEASFEGTFSMTSGPGYFRKLTAATLAEKGKDDKSVLLDVTIRFTGAVAQDNGSIENYFDMGDSSGAWDEILVDNRHEDSMTEGVFLLVGTEKKTFPNTTLDIVGGNFNSYAVDPIVVEKPNLPPVTYAPKQGVAFNSTLASTTATNIGQYLWKVNPRDSFFGKNPVTSKPIHITGLAPNTRYYFQVLLKEDAIGSPLLALGPVTEIMTQTTEEAAASNVDLTKQAEDSYVETPDFSATNTNAFSAELTCFTTDGDAPWFKINIGGCITEAFNSIFVSTSYWLAQTTGRLFDAFAAVSLGSTIYGQGAAGTGIASFVENGWSLVRDIANIFFIFILLYAALGLVLSLHHVNTKKIVAQVILIGLLINFSLFFCRVTIDASNILSRVFYNAMNICKEGEDCAKKNPPTTTGEVGVKEQSISAVIVGGVQPQKLLSTDSLAKLKQTGTVGTGTIFFVLLIAFILNMALAWIFFMCAAFFAGRIGVIWFSMIFAPLAFVTSIVPSLESNLKQLGWSTWLSGFMKACFNAPVFFFFLYLVVYLVGGNDGGLLGTTMSAVTDAGGNFVSFLVAIMLPTMIVIGLLMAAKKIAEEMAGQFGAAFAGIVSAGVGMASMAVTGGAAALGSKFIGGAAMKTLQNQDLKDAASGNTAKLSQLYGNKFGPIDDTAEGKRNALRAQQHAAAKLQRADKLSKSSFDLRQTGLGNALSSATGVNMNMGAGLIAPKSFGTDMTAGGQQARVDRKAAKEESFKKLLGQNDEKIHHLEHDNGDIDDGLKKPKEDLEEAESKQQVAKNKQSEANEAIKAYKEANPKAKSVPATLLKAKADADSSVKGANDQVDMLKNKAPIVIGGKTFNGIRGAEKQKKDNEKEIEKTKNVRQKDYVKFLKSQSEGGGSERTSRELLQAVRDGFKQMASGAASGGAMGAGAGLFAAGLTGGASVLAGGIAGSVVGAVKGAMDGGVMPAFRVMFTEGADALNEGLARGLSSGLNDQKVAWSGNFKGQSEQVAEQASHKEQHAHKFTATYKAPNSKLFDMFKGLGESAPASHDAGHHDAGDHGHGGH